MNEAGLVLSTWRREPWRFVEDVIGAAPTNQQREGLRELGRLYDCKFRRSLGQELSSEDRRYSDKIGLSIRSGHGTGKDAWLAWVYLWLLTCFPGARGLVTAPTQHQLQDILWAEMRVWLRRSRAKLWESIDIQSEKAYLKSGRGGDESFVVNRTAKVTGSQEEQAETLAGMHGDYMVLAVDEASGVPDGVFRPLEGAMTGKFNIAILIGNPTRNSGYFFQSHHLDRKNWVSLHWNCEDTDMDKVTGTTAMSAYVERMAAKYGTDSNFYRMRVQGEFPHAEPDALIPLDRILAAVDRDVGRIDDSQGAVIGVDVAHMGDDKSVIVVRRGMLVEEIISFSQQNTLEMAGHIMGAMADHAPKAVLVDQIGVGVGVVDQLRHFKKSVVGVSVSESASRKDKFMRLRDELYWRLRERFEKGFISIPGDDELIGELSSIKFKIELSGKVKIESKSEMRKRGLPSPNKADALMLTEYFPDTVFRNAPVDGYSGMFRSEKKRGGWMSA